MKGKILIILIMALSLFVVGCNSNDTENKETQVSEVKSDTENKEEQENLNEDVKQISAEEHNKKLMQDSLSIELEAIFQRDPNIDEGFYSYTSEFPLVIKNHTDDTIEGFIADTKFTNMFGDTLLELQIRYDQDLIPHNESVNWIGAYELNQFNDDDMRFFNTPSNNINFEYEILEIHFLNGRIYR